MEKEAVFAYGIVITPKPAFSTQFIHASKYTDTSSSVEIISRTVRKVPSYFLGDFKAQNETFSISNSNPEASENNFLEMEKDLVSSCLSQGLKNFFHNLHDFQK